MNVTLPPGSYVFAPEDFECVRRVMFRLYDGTALTSEGRKNLARILDDTTRRAMRVRDLMEVTDGETNEQS